MDLSSEHREKVCGDIIVAATTALKEGKITQAELMLISSSLLKTYEAVTTHQQLVSFLQELASHWSIFEPFYTFEKNEGSEEKEQQTITQMHSLLKSNQVDEAVKKGEEGLSGGYPQT